MCIIIADPQYALDIEGPRGKIGPNPITRPNRSGYQVPRERYTSGISIYKGKE